jgi:two-component system CAI-1 autoinducer sensor kinase/phosphatase CqsS
MYSVLPTVVSILFLLFGLYVGHSKGLNRVTTAFLILCITTFFWQFLWAILFQINDEKLAQTLINLGWLLILFLPTSLFHFLAEITGRQDVKKKVYISYVFSIFLALIHVTTNLIINGHYHYSWGFYPKAGIFHFLHVLQTTTVVTYGLYISYQKQKIVQAGEKTKLQYCNIALLLFSLSAIDYLCNYGFDFYPPGVVFIAVALGLIALATVKYHAMDDSRMMAASLAHEMRTPLATLRIQAKILSDYLPELISAYKTAEGAGLVTNHIDQNMLNHLSESAQILEQEVINANQAIDMLMALTTADYLNEKDFKQFSMKECIELAVSRVPYRSDLKKIVYVDVKSDFIIFASKEFLIFVFINLINNSLDALKNVDSGSIHIKIISDSNGNRVELLDDGAGIESDVLPHIFDRFFTTKNRGTNSGVGLAFCRNVMESFGGSINCYSKHGEFTQFNLSFKTKKLS